MGKLNEIKDKLEISLKSIDYEIWEYKDQLKTDISDVQREEIKKRIIIFNWTSSIIERNIRYYWKGFDK